MKIILITDIDNHTYLIPLQEIEYIVAYDNPNKDVENFGSVYLKCGEHIKITLSIFKHIQKALKNFSLLLL